MQEKRNNEGQTLEEFLNAYDPSIYKNPAVVVDMAVFSVCEKNNALVPIVLLIKRGNHPYIHEYALPGGFVEMDEEVEYAAARELFEEANIRLNRLYEFGTFGAVGKDPRTRIISIAHLGVAPMGTLKPKAGDDACDAGLFVVDFLRKENVCEVVLTSEGNELRFSIETENDDFFNLPIKIKRVYNTNLASDHAEILTKGLQHLCLMNRNTLLNQLKPPKILLERLEKALNDLALVVLGR
ncbi:MAG: NUDIX hydrolase [Clostridiales bacterium]|nr:NUDIX hydrolase [Clostridiales bacterium]